MYNERITIQKRTLAIKDGLQVETWAKYYTCWAAFMDLFGREKYESYNAKLENSIKFKVKTCRLIKNILLDTKDYKVIWRKQEFKIVFIDTFGYNSNEYILQVIKVN